MNLQAYLERRRRIVDRALERWVPGEDTFPPQLYRAMRYSLFAGGKRLRPILALGAAEAVGGRAVDALPLACSLELIHTYSLIHDDLPPLDDDDLRRGKPTSHKVFGEAVAILAGDGLLTEAFHLLTRTDLMKGVPPRRRILAIREVARAAGPEGMVGGQTMDIVSEGKKIKRPILEYIHAHKTGCLIAASVRAGALIGGGSARECEYLGSYGKKMGTAFQITDDLLDVLGEKARLGKAVGKDLDKGKATYPALLGIDESRRQARLLIEEAIGHLAPLLRMNRRAAPLREIAEFILHRTN